MIVDTSAAVAMLRDEPEAPQLLEAMDRADVVRMSACTVLELAIVTKASGPGLVDDFITGMGIQVVTVDEEQLRWARTAQERYGRGSGSPARLNYGDCFSYGAARAFDEPLLFKGDDFLHTDVVQVDLGDGTDRPT